MAQRIIVADDHPIYRDGMVRIVQKLVPDALVQEASTATDLARLASQDEPASLFLLDLLFPGFNGAASVRELRKRYPIAQIIVVSMLDEADTIQGVMSAGANGFIAKSVPPGEVVDAIIAVLNGDEVICCESAAALGLRDSPAAPAALSPRQHDVLRLLAQGLSNKEIARQLNISPFTVRIHVSALLRQFGMATRAAVAAHAIRSGLV